MAAAIPAAVSLGSSIYGHFKNKQKSVMSQDVLNEGLASARQARDQGGSLFGIGAPLLQAASGYWQKLLSGNPQALNEAVAPERQKIEESALGAERAIDAGPLRGGARDYAQADLNRTKFAQTGALYPAARLAAAQAGSGLGLSTASAGSQATSNAGGVFSSLYGGAERAREFDTEQGNKTGAAFSTLFTNLLQGYLDRNKTKKSAGTGAGFDFSKSPSLSF